MWQAISYITSGLTLAAFIIACGAAAYRRNILHKERQIEAAPSAQRARLVEAELAHFSVDTSNLTRDQQYAIAMAQIQGRAQQFRLVVVLLGIVFIVTGGFAGLFYYWSRSSPPNESLIGLQAANGKYVTADQNSPGHPLIAQNSRLQAWETFRLVSFGDGTVALRATDGMYVAVDANSPQSRLIAESISVQGREKFTWVDTSDGKFALKAANGKYVAIDPNSPECSLIAASSEVRSMEKFSRR